MARRIVTLPPSVHGAAARRFAERARSLGADLLELRGDLHSGDLDTAALAQILPLLVSERGAPLPSSWLPNAAEVDREIGSPEPGTVCSHHAVAPMSPEEAEALWAEAKLGARALKHVEPLGPLSGAERLFATQARLIERFGAGRVTVLATGPLALPWRARLAACNALDYLCLDATWAAAPGQRLLSDARRADLAPPAAPRLGILGHRIGHSRSPRIHPAPFDRIDLPGDVELVPLLQALLRSHVGLAITSPFKRDVARVIGATLPAVNTLVRRGDHWVGSNTDVEGARLVLRALDGPELCVLGDGGVTTALRLAAEESGRRLIVVRRGAEPRQILHPTVWTWPAEISPPPTLSFAGQGVAVVSYGPPARKTFNEIRRRHGVPIPCGSRWLIAQARAQRATWGLT